ncbi:MAG: beta-N-acetylhexosaminidase [Candidatus Borkfalkiaceae bacterium]|nr:beta-N-acetylhexosaminidase [Christensenellaceae bacterium]
MSEIRNIGVMLDMSRNGVMRPERLKRFIDLLSAMGYTYLQLYTEDTYEVEGQPYFGYMRGAYTAEELKEVDAYAAGKGIELIPCIQTLAHLQSIFKWEDYGDLCDCGDILLAGDERVYRLIDDIFATLAKNFTSRRVHIGMDEAHMVGLGKYLDLHGYEDRFGILARHLKRVTEIAEKYGFRPMMWSDMFFRLANHGQYYGGKASVSEELKKLVPANLELVYWDYYHLNKKDYDEMIEGHALFDNKTVFAGGAWSWTGFTPENGYSIKASKAALKSCREHGVEDVFVTLWGDNGKECSYFSLLPALLCFAEFAKGHFEMGPIKEKFAAIVGTKFDDFIRLDLPNDGFGNQDNYTNPSKYTLYSDVFYGFLDPTVPDGMGEYFGACARKLNRLAKEGEFAPLFSCVYRLCRVLEIKAELGKRARALYLAGDRAGMKTLAGKDMGVLLKRLDDFYSAFRALWYLENKAVGFEVQDVRLGGLMQRLKHVREILTDYADGKTEKIEEFEKPLLPYLVNGQPGESQVVFANWGSTVTSCPIN